MKCQLTWAEIKQAIEEEGVKDRDVVAYVDIHFCEHTRIEVSRTDHGWEIEMSK